MLRSLLVLLGVSACAGHPGSSAGGGSSGVGGGALADGGASSGGNSASSGSSPSGASGGGAVAGSSPGGSTSGDAGAGSVTDLQPPFAPELGKTALLIGQSGRRAHVDYVLGTASVPAGGSVYAELYNGKLLSFEQQAFVDYLAREQPGSLVEVGLSWKDNRVGAGYCDMADAACVAGGGAVEPELDIVAGKYDAALTHFAGLLKAYPSLKFLVRVDYEVSPNLHCLPSDKEACPAYRDAFRYVRKALREAGADNTAFVFHPTRGWARQMYPGADVTDWIAFSVFNHDLCLPTPEGKNGGCTAGAHLDQNLAADLAWAAEQGKPILIAEATVQKPSDGSASGFNDYLSRLLEIVERYPQVRGLTYINIKWAGGWIYGEDWSTGAFGDVDARLAHFPETRAFFCDKLSSGRYLGLKSALLGCDARKPTFVRALPPDLDAPVAERIIALGGNRCLRQPAADTASGAVELVDCASLAETGEGRVRLLESGGEARFFGDASWLCWSAEGEQLLQRPCASVKEQRFGIEELSKTAQYRELHVIGADGRCLAVQNDAPSSARLVWAACAAAPEQTFRL
jgi:hypothetical protein